MSTAEPLPDSLHIACPACLAVNRVPGPRLAGGQGGRCGKCRRPLFDSRPVALTPANFDTLVGRTQVPVVVDFWAAWCGPCKAFAPVFEDAARRLEPRLRFAKLDTEASPELAARFAIRGIPTVAVFRGGQEIARQSGAMNAGQFQAWLHSIPTPG